MNDTSTGKMPPLVSLLMVIVGALISVIGGFGVAAIVGGLVAAAGAIPAVYGTWTGMQQRTQTALGLSVVMIAVSLGSGALLLLLSILGWV